MKKYEERKAFLLDMFDNVWFYPYTPSNDEIVDAYAEKFGAKVDRLGRCNLLSRDFTRMYQEGLIERDIFGNTDCVGMGKPRWSYIYRKKSEK